MPISVTSTNSSGQGSFQDALLAKYISPAVSEKYKQRITVKDIGVTQKDVPSDISSIHKIGQYDEIKELVGSRVRATPHTEEYIVIKRRFYISRLLKAMACTLANLDSQSQFSIYITQFKNIVDDIYESFLKTGQDEVFLSIVMLYEDILVERKPCKRDLKSAIYLLKKIQFHNRITAQEYSNIISEFFSMGVDVTFLKESE